MTREAIRSGVLDVLKHAVRVSGSVALHSDLVGDLHLDSIQRLELVVALENRFRICLGPEDEERIRTVADLVDIIAARTMGGGLTSAEVGHDA